MNAKLWRKSDSAAKRYFAKLQPDVRGWGARMVETAIFRTAWALGYRAGRRSRK